MERDYANTESAGEESDRGYTSLVTISSGADSSSLPTEGRGGRGAEDGASTVRSVCLPGQYLPEPVRRVPVPDAAAHRSADAYGCNVRRVCGAGQALAR